MIRYNAIQKLQQLQAQGTISEQIAANLGSQIATVPASQLSELLEED